MREQGEHAVNPAHTSQANTGGKKIWTGETPEEHDARIKRILDQAAVLYRKGKLKSAVLEYGEKLGQEEREAMLRKLRIGY